MSTAVRSGFIGLPTVPQKHGSVRPSSVSKTQTGVSYYKLSTPVSGTRRTNTPPKPSASGNNSKGHWNTTSTLQRGAITEHVTANPKSILRCRRSENQSQNYRYGSSSNMHATWHEGVSLSRRNSGLSVVEDRSRFASTLDRTTSTTLERRHIPMKVPSVDSHAVHSTPSQVAPARSTKPAVGSTHISATLPSHHPTPTPPPRKKGQPTGLVGLRNLGNTCFLNSTVQCLVQCGELTAYFSSPDLKKDFGGKRGGELARCFAEVVRAIREGKPYSTVSPTTFKTAVGKYAPMFSGYQQHDSQEFLRYLLDCLHEDLNRVRRPPPYAELNDLPKESELSKADRWWTYFCERGDSFLSDCFRGQLRSRVVCCVCNHVSSSFDPFWDISVPIPKTRGFGGGSTDLSTCLASFSEEEVLDGNDKYYCGRCKKHQRCKKKLDIHRLPPILVIHLKRFSYSTFSRSKVNTTVKFPTQGLDVAKYTSAHEFLKGSAPRACTTYDLTAVCNHMGGMGGGHYTAFCMREDGEWYNFDDARCTAMAAASLQGPSAYVLFYRRRDADVNFSVASVTGGP
eukprot:Rmarinus@m.3361